jgi:hypothetical protein
MNNGNSHMINYPNREKEIVNFDRVLYDIHSSIYPIT